MMCTRALRAQVEQIDNTLLKEDRRLCLPASQGREDRTNMETLETVNTKVPSGIARGRVEDAAAQNFGGWCLYFRAEAGKSGKCLIDM